MRAVGKVEVTALQVRAVRKVEVTAECLLIRKEVLCHRMTEKLQTCFCICIMPVVVTEHFRVLVFPRR